MVQEIQCSGYRIVLDQKTGRWIGLYDSIRPDDNWIKEENEVGFCTPFIHGTQTAQDSLVCPLVMAEQSLTGRTESGATRLQILLEEEIICVHFETPVDNGPRIGLQMDFNFLDLPYAGSWKQQCMPKIIYVDETYQYGYLVFGTSDHRYLVLSISEPFAAWRILYSYEGHRMTGFQLLNQADDVRTDGRAPLPVVGKLNFQIQFCHSVEECLRKAAAVLHKAIVMPGISGGPVGAQIPYDIYGACQEILIKEPDGTQYRLTGSRIHLHKCGIYQVIAVASDGSRHISHILCHEEWEQQFDCINVFYQTHLQHETGACYRAVSADTLLPDQDCMDGCAMGDPFSHYSCRTGEFGGFAAWAMMKNELLFGRKSSLHGSVERYMLHWALGRGHEEQPYMGALNKNPAIFLGRRYGRYHLYEEYNYMQHEIFLLEEMADYYLLTGDEAVKEDALCMVEHIAAEHLREDGALINQNFPDTPGLDYSTVHIPICAFLRWADILNNEAPEKAQRILALSEKIADYVCRRALQFPTEGEQCTEDGSMSCAAATLLYAYMKLEPKPEYVNVAKEILSAHHVLELSGTDCRMKNATLRFWETQYETREFGPSINAGHAWTIWTAEAKAALALIEKRYVLLQEAYEGFITNICKVTESGGMYCCYTPDMIPGTPHGYWKAGMKKHTLAQNDLRPTTTHLGMRYPIGYFTTSGNYYLIKAAEIWSRISGLDLENKRAVNGVIDDDTFRSCAKNFDCILISGTCACDFKIHCKPNSKIQILFSEDTPQISGAEIMKTEAGSITVRSSAPFFVVKF